MENSTVIQVKISTEDKQMLLQRANELRLTLSSYCRMLLIKDIDDEL
jgi:hypothetical protein